MINASQPASDKIFDVSAFEKFLHDRIKVEGKTGQLGENVKIHRDGASNPPSCLLVPLLKSIRSAALGDTKITVTSSIPLSKRYLKYLTKKFLKKNTLRDWIRYAPPSYSLMS